MKRWILGLCLLVLAQSSCGGSDQPARNPEKTEHDTELPGTMEEAQTELQKAKMQVESASECEQLCKAFASMRRSQSAICVLVGDEDPRCTVAKQTVSDSAKRVAKCGCPGSAP